MVEKDASFIVHDGIRARLNEAIWVLALPLFRQTTQEGREQGVFGQVIGYREREYAVF